MDLQVIAELLLGTISVSKNERKVAESNLQLFSFKESYPLNLLKLVESGNLDLQIRLAAAIAFKNQVKNHWKTSDFSDYVICENDRKMIKTNILNVMLGSNVQTLRDQLSESIVIIGREDFPQDWQNLLPEMVVKLATNDFDVLFGLLKVMCQLFRRYKTESRSNKLFTEIKYAISLLGDPILKLFDTCISTLYEICDKPENSATALKIYSIVLDICKIFYNLNYQDLAEYFEDTMSKWMGNFQKLMESDFSISKYESGLYDDGKGGLVEQVRSLICDIISLYTTQYDDEFVPFLQVFVQLVWKVLSQCTLDKRYDLIVSKTIDFLAIVATGIHSKNLFQDEGTIRGLCENVVLPNIYLRDSDETRFNEDHEEWIRENMEGTWVFSRRKSACELVKALCKSFESVVVVSFKNYLEFLLNKYSQAPDQNWRDKDAALFLVTAMANQGQTERHGVTATIQFLDVGSFFREQVLPEIVESDLQRVPLIKADCLKFIVSFRSILSGEVIQQVFPHIFRFLLCNHVVTHSYAAICIDKLLMLRSTQLQPVICKTNLPQPHQTIIDNFMALFQAADSSFNEFGLRGLIRVCAVMDDLLLPCLNSLVLFLSNKLSCIVKCPQKPNFNYYLFEAICLCIRIACKSNAQLVKGFENLFFESVQVILRDDIADFVPYAFQILATMLSVNKEEANLSDTYRQLYPVLLEQQLWEVKQNVGPLVVLFNAYIRVAPSLVGSDLVKLLGIFQRLNVSNSTDHFGLEILTSLFSKNYLSAPDSVLLFQQKALFHVIFDRLTNNKTQKYIRGILLFLAHYIVVCSANQLADVLYNLSATLFPRVLEKIFIAELRNLSLTKERILVSVASVRLLCECDRILKDEFSNLWKSLLEKLIESIEMPRENEVSIEKDYRFLEMSNDREYSGRDLASSCLMVFSKLDELQGPITVNLDLRLYLAEKIHALMSSKSETMSRLSKLNPCAQEYLAKYFQLRGVSLN